MRKRFYGKLLAGLTAGVLVSIFVLSTVAFGATGLESRVTILKSVPGPIEYRDIAVTIQDFGPGIAGTVENDADLRNHPSVLTYDDFTDYGPNNDQVSFHVNTTGALSFPQRYRGHNLHRMRIEQAGSEWGFFGKSALRMELNEATRVEQNSGMSQWLKGSINPQGRDVHGDPFSYDGYETLFSRSYIKFSPNYAISGSNHQGMSLAGGYSVKSLMEAGEPGFTATPGYKSNGYNKFLGMMEWYRGGGENPDLNIVGATYFYTYVANQYGGFGDHWRPNRSQVDCMQLWGPWFEEGEMLWLEAGRWYCVEFMLQLNTVEEEGEYYFPPNNPGNVNVVVTKEPKVIQDGRMVGWIDGVKVLDYNNIVIRNTNNLRIDEWGGIGFHCQTNGIPIGAGDHYMWVTNVVLATEYIGPMKNDPRKGDPLYPHVDW